jgi:hypothetical protein
MIRYKKAEQVYIFGPVGHTDDPNYPFHPYDQYYWYEEQYNPARTPPITPGMIRNTPPPGSGTMPAPAVEKAVEGR